MLFRSTTALALALLALAPATPAWASPGPAKTQSAERPLRVLLVVSSHGRGTGEVQPGFEMDELAQAWLVLRRNGLTVDIASPAGGAVIADAFDPKKAYNTDFAADTEAQRKTADTLRLDPAMAGQYDAVMVIGGKGAMFDLPFSQVLQTLLAETERNGGVVSAVCHGPAVFARIRTEDGQPWASGRQLTGFADEEEALFGKRWVPHFPFLLESELRRLEAQFSEAPIMLPHVVADGRVVTGQNPFSVGLAADAVVRALGQEPAPRQPWADERSLSLVAQAIAGDAAPLEAALARKDESLDVPLIAIWGYYRSIEAGEDRAMLEPAVRIMELALPHFPEPQLETAIREARSRLGGG